MKELQIYFIWKNIGMLHLDGGMLEWIYDYSLLKFVSETMIENKFLEFFKNYKL